MPNPKPDTPLRRAVLNFLHLAVLTSFALAQPLFDILGKNPEFFAVRGSTSTQIVLLALVVTLALPLVLVGVELLLGLFSRPASDVLHVVFIGALAGVIVLHFLAKRDALTGVVALVAAALVGAAAAVLYWRARPARMFLTVLAPVPLLFLALFLGNSQVSKLVFGEDAHAQTAPVQSTTPVVFLLFDEFPEVSLMDRSGKIDATRWPNFAALARESTWYRNATTVHDHTQGAVPAILSGKLPEKDALPIFADHPQNLFTYLGGSYDLKVVEVLRLCPPSLCHGVKSSEENGSLANDVGVVYLHLVLPEPYASRLPSITGTWGNFGGDEKSDEEEASPPSPSTKPRATVPPCGRRVCEFASLITRDTRPTLYFLHASLPHIGWMYLPSGKSYATDTQYIPGEHGTWEADPWLTTQAKQRYLLQVGDTDAALGYLVRKLRAAGIYDRALVVVTADHGESFVPGTPRRNVKPANLADVAFVPLFIKLPGQEDGRIDDVYERSVDILPTIADVLDSPLPWKSDGRSLISTTPPSNPTVHVVASHGPAVQAPLAELEARRAQELREQIATFGTGPIGRVYDIGPNRELLGKAVRSLAVRPNASSNVELDGRELLQVVDLAGDRLPSYVTGRVSGSYAPRQPLAVAVNGKIGAVTRTYLDKGTTKFAALVPETAFRQGANDVKVYAVLATGSGLVLEQLGSNDLVYMLPSNADALQASDGKTIQIRRGALTGEVRATRKDGDGWLDGWAADIQARKPAEKIVVIVGNRSVYVGRPGQSRKDIRARYHVLRTGFTFRIPGALLPKHGEGQAVRVYAVRGDAASELGFAGGNPWAR